jgi:hypothetical protein
MVAHACNCRRSLNAALVRSQCPPPPVPPRLYASIRIRPRPLLVKKKN